MRQRFFWNPSGSGKRWPEDMNTLGVNNIQKYSWVKVDNRGSNPVLVGLGAQPQNDQMDYYAQVSGGKVRVFNVATQREDGQAIAGGDSYPEELHLLAITGATTVLIELSDQPIVDVISTI